MLTSNPKQWYFEVNLFCQDLSVIYNVELIKVAAILAALSPQNKFDQNLIDLVNFLETNGKSKASTFGNQRDKAKQILFMDNPCEESVKNILGKGLKTRSFFENIYRPESSQAVTVDLWQIRWAKQIGMLKTKSLTDKQYRRIEARVKKYAKKTNMLPHQFQAMTWVYMRGEIY
jgi:hypothetical protein